MSNTVFGTKSQAIVVSAGIFLTIVIASTTIFCCCLFPPLTVPHLLSSLILILPINSSNHSLSFHLFSLYFFYYLTPTCLFSTLALCFPPCPCGLLISVHPTTVLCLYTFFPLTSSFIYSFLLLTSSVFVAFCPLLSSPIHSSPPFPFFCHLFSLLSPTH